jgi:hypothetical protein
MECDWSSDVCSSDLSSSNTLFQLCSANTYVELYFKQYEDLIGYEELNQVLLEKYKTTCE